MDPKELRGLMEAYAEMYAPIDENRMASRKALGLGEATAMAKRGKDETAIRNKIASSTGGGQSADRAGALADRPTYGQSGTDPKARANYARKQMGDFRKTNSSNPGLHGYGHKSNDPDVKAKQAARGAQRGSATLTPNEKKKLNMGEAVKGASRHDTEMRKAAASERRSGVKNRLSASAGKANADKMERDVKYMDKLTKNNKIIVGMAHEEVDLFDTVLEFLYVEGYAETLEEAEWLMANVIDEEAIDIIIGEGKLPLDKERRTKIGNQIGKRLQSSGSEIIGSGSAFMPKGIRNNLRQSAAKKVGEVKKMMGALKSAQKESYDLYDIILSHLIDEGYADTQEQAEVIMVNMSEEWRDSIIETRMDPRGRPASGPMNVYANPKKPSQAHLDAVKAYDAAQKKKTPEQKQKELDAYRNRKMYS